MLEKCDVNGDQANEGYKYLRNNSALQGADIKWNFSKFLVDKDGKVVQNYGHKVHPDEIRPHIDQLIQW